MSETIAPAVRNKCSENTRFGGSQDWENQARLPSLFQSHSLPSLHPLVSGSGSRGGRDQLGCSASSKREESLGEGSEGVIPLHMLVKLLT